MRYEEQTKEKVKDEFFHENWTNEMVVETHTTCLGIHHPLIEFYENKCWVCKQGLRNDQRLIW